MNIFKRLFRFAFPLEIHPGDIIEIKICSVTSTGKVLYVWEDGCKIESGYELEHTVYFNEVTRVIERAKS